MGYAPYPPPLWWLHPRSIVVKFRKFNLFRFFKCSKCGSRPPRYWTVFTEFYGPGGIHTLVHRYCMLCCFTRYQAEKLQKDPVCAQSSKHGQMRPVSSDGGK